MKILILIIPTICVWLFACKPIEGSDIDCTDCACCINRTCELGRFFDNECTSGCIDGFAGARCYEKCPVFCKACMSKNGTLYCTICNDGFFQGPKNSCRSECLPRCKTCITDNNCTSCKNGFYDIENSCNKSCPENCLNCSSNSHCHACKDGHYNGFHNDESSVPFITNCTNECRVNCKQCTSYNACSVCKYRRYGSICDRICSAGCTAGICDIQTGNCDCFPDFIGDKCDRCIKGKYGELCDKQCSAGCQGNTCDKETGNCIDGCIQETIVGVKCDACSTGWYGPNCNLSCSIGCKIKQCKRDDGECTEGCLNKFQGRQCDHCVTGKYGDLCNISCPSQCNENKCLKESGNCIQCLENLVGTKCERCVAGLYGSTCSETCPTNCLNNICDRFSGKCSYGCIDNYSGDRCCLESNNCVTCSSDTKCKQCKSGYYHELCDKNCSQHCADSCDIETGKCDDCKPIFYGDMCTLPCSITCENASSDIENICKRENGFCKYGCSGGFYGLKCTEKCSDRCVDNICDQENGKCIMGCQVIKEDPFCPTHSASCPPVNSNSMALIALGTSFAVSLVANVLFVIYLVLPRVRQRNQRTDSSSYVNAGGITASINTNEENTCEDNYENIEIDQVSGANYEGIQQDPRSN